jgi:hypothetical protein
LMMMIIVDGDDTDSDDIGDGNDYFW